MDSLVEEYKFSVLMSVYKSENPEYLRQALNSVIDQSLVPDEIVIVKDGTLTKNLDAVITEFCNKYTNLFSIVPIKKNVGLGLALRQGILECSHELIARMDTDDIAVPERFEKQIDFLKKNQSIDIVGSYISEFENTLTNVYAQRQVPLEHDKIKEFAKFRCPMNHMTVMYKKQSVLESGNYQDFKYIEDYHLWGRMLQKGLRFANIPENLVKVRAGKTMLVKRAGLEYFIKVEFKLHKFLYDIKFINFYQFLRNICLKFILRTMPLKLMRLTYEKILRS